MSCHTCSPRHGVTGMKEMLNDRKKVLNDTTLACLKASSAEFFLLQLCSFNKLTEVLGGGGIRFQWIGWSILRAHVPATARLRSSGCVLSCIASKAFTLAGSRNAVVQLLLACPCVIGLLRWLQSMVEVGQGLPPARSRSEKIFVSDPFLRRTQARRWSLQWQ
jgi:hypothetical protein